MNYVKDRIDTTKVSVLFVLTKKKGKKEMEAYLFGMFSAIIVIAAMEKLCEGSTYRA